MNDKRPPLGILLLDGGHERAHYALVMASGAAALGREVVLFATNGGCRRIWPRAASPALAPCWKRLQRLASSVSPAKPG